MSEGEQTVMVRQVDSHWWEAIIKRSLLDPLHSIPLFELTTMGPDGHWGRSDYQAISSRYASFHSATRTDNEGRDGHWWEAIIKRSLLDPLHSIPLLELTTMECRAEWTDRHQVEAG